MTQLGDDFFSEFPNSPPPPSENETADALKLLCGQLDEQALSDSIQAAAAAKTNMPLALKPDELSPQRKKRGRPPKSLADGESEINSPKRPVTKAAVVVAAAAASEQKKAYTVAVFEHRSKVPPKRTVASTTTAAAEEKGTEKIFAALQFVPKPISNCVEEMHEMEQFSRLAKQAREELEAALRSTMNILSARVEKSLADATKQYNELKKID